MKVATFFVGGAALFAASTFAFAQTKWDMATGYPDSNFHTKNINRFAQEVDRVTNGSLKITVHPNSSLVKLPDIKRAVRDGTIPIGETLVSLNSNESPIYGLEAIPFLATSYPATRRLYNIQRPYLEKKLAEQNIQLLYSVAWPPPGIFAKKEIKTTDDLKGLKFRTFNAATSRMATLVGALPVQVEQAEVPLAFVNGGVQAMMTSPTSGVDTKVWEFVSHYHSLPSWQPRNMVIVNKAAFDKLTATEKSAVLSAARTAEERGWKESAEETAEKTQVLIKMKMTIVEPSEALKQSFAEIGRTMAAEWEKEAGGEGQAILKTFREGAKQ